MNNQHNLESLLHSEGVQEKLAALCLKKQIGDASVAISVGPTTKIWRADNAGNVTNDDSMEVLVGCLTKSFTASLFAAVLQQHAFTLTTPLSALAHRYQLFAHPRLSELTGVQLFTHTHGLDDSILDHSWADAENPLDLEPFGQALADCQPIAMPGTLYSYGSAGATLAGLCIEQLTQEKYEQALRKHLCDPLGIKPIRSDMARLDEGEFIRPICPASGGALALSIREIAAYLRWHAGSVATESPSLQLVPNLLRSHRESLAGWSPFEEAVCLGWKHYVGGWLGHNSNLCGHSLIVRFLPEAAISIVVATRNSQSKGDTALTVMMNLFGQHLQEFSQMKIPRRLKPEETQTLQGNRFAGTYANARHAINIDGENQPFGLRFSNRQDAKLIADCRLIPAPYDIFFTDPADPHLFPYLQFIRPDSNNRCTYIWNGKTTWPRRDT